jgi:hypothetical protein
MALCWLNQSLPRVRAATLRQITRDRIRRGMR